MIRRLAVEVPAAREGGAPATDVGLLLWPILSATPLIIRDRVAIEVH